MNNIKMKLEELEEIEEEIEAHKVKYEQKIIDVMPEKVKNQIDLLKKQLIDLLDPITMLRDQLEKEIKSAVLAGRSSIKSDNYQAIYIKSRTSWDTKALNGYALTRPEILELKKVGKPSVRIKR